MALKDHPRINVGDVQNYLSQFVCDRLFRFLFWTWHVLGRALPSPADDPNKGVDADGAQLLRDPDGPTAVTLTRVLGGNRGARRERGTYENVSRPRISHAAVRNNRPSLAERGEKAR